MPDPGDPGSHAEIRNETMIWSYSSVAAQLSTPNAPLPGAAGIIH